MSTLEATRQTQSGGARFRIRLLALGALIAAGAAALILALSGSNHATNTHPAIATHPAIGTQARPYPRPMAVQSPAPAGYFRDPTTHKLVRVPTTAAATQAAPASSPSVQSILQSLTPAQRHYALGIAALSRSQQAAAFGTGQGSSEPGAH
jgi:hypothetical protein